MPVLLPYWGRMFSLMHSVNKLLVFLSKEQQFAKNFFFVNVENKTGPIVWVRTNDISKLWRKDSRVEKA